MFISVLCSCADSWIYIHAYNVYLSLSSLHFFLNSFLGYFILSSSPFKILHSSVVFSRVFCLLPFCDKACYKLDACLINVSSRTRNFYVFHVYI